MAAENQDSGQGQGWGCWRTWHPNTVPAIAQEWEPSGAIAASYPIAIRATPQGPSLETLVA